MSLRRSEFHSHTILTDGETVGIEMIRQAVALGLRAITITDHVSLGNIEWVVEAEIAECELARDWDIVAIPGVEITHVPPNRIDESVARARRAGAKIVVVHGETLAESVAPGTNRVAVSNPEVDVLAHPGLLSEEEADLARSNEVFVELSGRRGHMITNGHVARIGQGAHATLIVDSDAHRPDDLLSGPAAERIARGAGLDGPASVGAAFGAPSELLRRLGYPP